MERLLGALGIEVPSQLFESTPESSPEPTSPPDLPEVVGLNDVISHFNGSLTTLSANSNGAISRRLPRRSG